jgi:hypothetical protein
MHDAQKPHYHEGMHEFGLSRFYNGGEWVPFADLRNKVWLGSLDNKAIFEQLVSWE